MINTAQAALSALYLFPRLTPNDAVSLFDASKQIKMWRDPNPSIANGFASPTGDSLVVYSSYRVNAGKVEKFSFFLTEKEAKSSNIPPVNWTGTSAAGYKEIPFPCRSLEPGESFATDFGGNIIVRNDALFAQVQKDSGQYAGDFTEADRTALYNLAAIIKNLPVGGGKDYTSQLNSLDEKMNRILVKLSIQI